MSVVPVSPSGVRGIPGLVYVTTSQTRFLSPPLLRGSWGRITSALPVLEDGSNERVVYPWWRVVFGFNPIDSPALQRVPSHYSRLVFLPVVSTGCTVPTDPSVVSYISLTQGVMIPHTFVSDSPEDDPTTSSRGCRVVGHSATRCPLVKTRRKIRTPRAVDTSPTVAPDPHRPTETVLRVGPLRGPLWPPRVGEPRRNSRGHLRAHPTPARRCPSRHCRFLDPRPFPPSPLLDYRTVSVKTLVSTALHPSSPHVSKSFRPVDHSTRCHCSRPLHVPGGS